MCSISRALLYRFILDFVLTFKDHMKGHVQYCMMYLAFMTPADGRLFAVLDLGTFPFRVSSQCRGCPINTFHPYRFLSHRSFVLTEAHLRRLSPPVLTRANRGCACCVHSCGVEDRPQVPIQSLAEYVGESPGGGGVDIDWVGIVGHPRENVQVSGIFSIKRDLVRGKK